MSEIVVDSPKPYEYENRDIIHAPRLPKISDIVSLIITHRFDAIEDKQTAALKQRCIDLHESETEFDLTLTTYINYWEQTVDFEKVCYADIVDCSTILVAEVFYECGMYQIAEHAIADCIAALEHSDHTDAIDNLNQWVKELQDLQS